MLPFTHQQFTFVFALYNGVVWPLQWLAQAAGIAMLAMALWPSPGRDRANVLLLAAMWLWTGLVYHVGFFSLINPAATTFGVVFVLQGLLLLEAADGGRNVLGERAAELGGQQPTVLLDAILARTAHTLAVSPAGERVKITKTGRS